MVPKKFAPALVPAIVKYDPLLQRYARFIVKDTAITAPLVKEVFEIVYELDGFNNDAITLRRQLKEYTLKACNHWLRTQPNKN
jgi:hypothetical protein